MNPVEVLRHHVIGAIERGEAVAIAGIPASDCTYLVRLENSLGPYGSMIATYRIQAGSDTEARTRAVDSAAKAGVRVRSIVSCERMV